MLIIRLLFAATLLVSVPFGLCSSSDDTATVSDQNKALTAAIVSIGDEPNPLPTIGQNYNCTIAVTHQPAPPASPFHDVKGSCKWSVVPQGTFWLATFSETWFCDDWSGHVASYPDCVPPTGTHSWGYQVDLATQAVTLISNAGPFAPDQH